MPLQIDPADSREVQAAVLAVKNADRELAGSIRKATRETLAPAWKSDVDAKSSTKLEKAVLTRWAKATVSNQNLAVVAASSTRKLRGGLVPARNPWGIEMGSTKHNQFKGRNSRGYVVKPLASQYAVRAVSLWVQTIVRQYMEARDKAEGRG